jgi:plasmid replication initiation protein
MLKKKEVIKHSNAIHVTNNISLLQRKIWNIFLAEAYDNLLKKERHKINYNDLILALWLSTKNRKHIEQSIKGLVSIIVKWDILWKNKNSDEWVISSLLAWAKFIDWVFYYSFSPFLKEELYNPKMYAKIKLSIQNKFTSKHTLALYELCIDYLRMPEWIWETAFIDIEIFKELLWINNITTYDKFKFLNLYVITKAINEINEKSNIHVELQLKRTWRKVSAVKFLFYLKREAKLLSTKELSSKQTDQTYAETKISKKVNTQIKPDPIRDLNLSKAQEEVYLSLVSIWITKTKAWNLTVSHDLKKIKMALKMRKLSSSVKNQGWWVIKALEEDYDLETTDDKKTKLEDKKYKEEESKREKEILKTSSTKNKARKWAKDNPKEFSDIIGRFSSKNANKSISEVEAYAYVQREML